MGFVHTVQCILCILGICIIIFYCVKYHLFTYYDSILTLDNSINHKNMQKIASEHFTDLCMN